MPGISRTHAISVQDYRLHYLSLAARHGSMRAAADVLGVAPSSISRQISQLERDLKIDLVERGTHKMQLTEAGMAVVAYYDSRVKEYEVLLSRLADMRNSATGTIRLAVGDGLLTEGMLSCIRSISDGHGEFMLDVVATSAGEVQRMVMDDTAEIGILLDFPDNIRLRVQGSVVQPICLIGKPQHPLLRANRSVSLVEISKERFVLPSSNHRITEILSSVFRDKGVSLQVALSSNSLQTVIDSVVAGVGIAMLPPILAAREIASGTLIAAPIACEELASTKLFVVSRIGRRLNATAVKLMAGLCGALQRAVDDASDRPSVGGDH